MALISVPRDLAVPIENKGWQKVNSINAYAEMEERGSGGEAVSQALGDILGVPIDYYIRVDFVGFVNIINDDRNLLVLDKKIKVCMPEFLKNLKESHYFQNPEIQASLNRFFILKQENIKESYIKKM